MLFPNDFGLRDHANDLCRIIKSSTFLCNKVNKFTFLQSVLNIKLFIHHNGTAITICLLFNFRSKTFI